MIVSGGQTGADRGALDAALALNVPIGGWVPKGRLAEDGRIPDVYPMQESDSPDYAVRTRLNVRDSDGTLIISHGSLRGGSAFTEQCALELGRPWMHVDLTAQSIEQALDGVRSWIARHEVLKLNVAGPRHSQDPEIYRLSFTLTSEILRSF